MHRPAVDLTTKQPLPLEKQDKRGVIPLDPSNFDQWLEGTVEQARDLMRLAPTELFDAKPLEPEQKAKALKSSGPRMSASRFSPYGETTRSYIPTWLTLQNL